MSAINQHRQEYWTNVLNTVREPNVRSWILLNPASVGDTWIVSAFAKAFKEKHGGRLTMVVKPGQEALPQMYNMYIDRILACDNLHHCCDQIQPITTFDMDQPIIAHSIWHGDGRLGELFGLATLGKGTGLLFDDLYKFTLRLNWNAKIERPTIPDFWRESAISYAREIGMVEGKSVILFPDNNTVPNFPNTIWEKIAERLLFEDKIVFTNLVGGEYTGRRSEPIAGTKAINVTLQHVFPLAEYAGRVISGPTGLRVMLLASEVAADVTTLILQPRPDENPSLNLLGVGNAAFIQSLKFTGLRDWSNPAYEYPLYQSEDLERLDTIADDIVTRNPERALRW